MTRTITRKRKPIEYVEGFHFDPVAHAYTLDGKPLHGVTSVLRVLNKPALIQWSANMAVDYVISHPLTLKWLAQDQTELGISVTTEALKEARVAHRKKKESAGEIGTGVHAEIEAYINYCMEHQGWAVPLLNNLGYVVTPQTKEFAEWAVKNGVTFLASEIRLYSRDWWCAGTADFIAKIGDKLYIGDIKTGKAIYQEYWFQTGAYAKMAVEMGIQSKFDGLIVVNVPKEGGIKVEEHYDLEGTQKAFEACLYLHKLQEAYK